MAETNRNPVMRHISFSLCSRCKQCVENTVTVMVGNRLCGYVCNECVKPLDEMITGELTRVPIPEALKPYLKLT